MIARIRNVAIVVLALTALLLPWQLTYGPAADAASVRYVIGNTAIQPAPVVAGATATLTAKVQAKTNGTITISATVRNSANTVAWQTSWPNQTFINGESRTYSVGWAVPASQAPGDYTLTVRALNSSGNDVAKTVTLLVKLINQSSNTLPTATPTSVPVTVTATSVSPTATATPVPPTATAVLPTATATRVSTTLDTEEASFLVLINQYRQDNGLPALSLNTNLTAASKWMSGDMVAKNYFSHVDSLGRQLDQRLDDFGYVYNTWKGENLSVGGGTATQVFEAWKNSDSHKATMLNPNYRVIGIGRAYSAGKQCWYWTTDFGGV